MGVAEIEHVSARGIEKRRAERIDPLAPADHRGLPSARKGGERLQGGFDRRFAAAGQSDGKEVHQRPLDLMNDGRLQDFPARLDHLLRQPFGDPGILRHYKPRKKARSIRRPARKRKHDAPLKAGVPTASEQKTCLERHASKDLHRKTSLEKTCLEKTCLARPAIVCNDARHDNEDGRGVNRRLEQGRTQCADVTFFAAPHS